MPKYILLTNWNGSQSAKTFDTIADVEAYFVKFDLDAAYNFNKPPYEANLYEIGSEWPLAIVRREVPQPAKTFARYTVQGMET